MSDDRTVYIPIEDGSVDLNLRIPVRRRIDVVLDDEHRCPEAVIFSKPEDVSLVITQCERDGGHDGNHTAITETGTAEWPRIKPCRQPDEPEPF